MTTPGFKARHLFSSLVADAQNETAANPVENGDSFVDFTAGKMQNTGNSLDLALAGRGFFVVRSGGVTQYTRAGAFSRDADGHLVTPAGAVLQANGGDVALGAGPATVLADGTILQDGQPIDRLAIADFADPRVLRPSGAGTFTAPDGAARETASPQIRQGVLETSNVSTADEMLSVMAALRSAEAGQRAVQVYDDLMGRAITAFGQT